MKQVEVLLESYNAEALERGLGVKLSELSKEQLSKMLTHALGYVDYTDSSIANELKEIAGIEKPQTFYALYQRGEVPFDTIHDYIDAWHNDTDTEKEIYEYLGLTRKQYAEFVKDEDSLR